MSIRVIQTRGAFKVEDRQPYQQWLNDPDPDLWSGDSPTPVWRKHRDRPNPDWKPLRKPLSRLAAHQAVAKVPACAERMCPGYLLWTWCASTTANQLASSR